MPLILVQGSSAGAWGFTNNGLVAINAVAVTWNGGRTSGNLLLLAANSDSTITTPTGWTLDKSQVNNSGLYLWKRIADNTSTDTPTINNGASTCIAWAEYSGNTATPTDVSANQGSSSDDNSAFSTNTTGTMAQADELGVALWGGSHSTAIGTWGSQTNSFVEVVDTATTKVSGTNVNLCVAVKDLNGVATVESTATPSLTCAKTALMVTYKAAAAVTTIPNKIVSVNQSVMNSVSL